MKLEEMTNFINNFSYNSVVIISYFMICLIVLILNTILNGKVNKFLSIRKGSLLNPMTYIRLITSGLCHSNWTHFRNNFIMILLVGPLLEEKYGSIPLLEMLLITTAISSLLHLFIYENSAIGASDNVYMLVVLCSIVNITEGKIPITLILIFLFYVADEIIKLLKNKKDNVSHDSHIIGAICGFIFGYFIF
ncbi:MAG: rhomboid family intramembrane serine protease [Bacilli bacterium]|nr:rhomboid family intramembrane serine protease [Bacilli bacterium]